MFACRDCKNSRLEKTDKIWCSAQKTMVVISPTNGEHLANCTFYEKN